MCGIVGIIDKEGCCENILSSMRDELSHRGPDDAGIWISLDKTAGFGHRRLSIIDLSSAGRQPMMTSDERFILTFNGEIYNFLELKKELLKEGCQFNSKTDGEVLLNSYVKWGEKMVPKLRGMFAFAIWDQQEKKLFCARDRVGEKPFYFYRAGDCFIFASELKAVVKHPKFRKKINYYALIDFLAYGYIPAPKSIWENCHKLLPGHILHYCPDEERLDIREYWDIQFDFDYSKNDNQWIDEILGQLEESVKLMLASDVPLGAFLSGGVDSGSVVAMMCSHKDTVRTFSIGFNEAYFDESKYAEKVARKHGANHVNRIVTPKDVEELIPKMCLLYDEPFGDYSYIPTFMVSKLAREKVKVILSGDGGDELFGGYSRYWRLFKLLLLDKFIPLSMRRKFAPSLYPLIPENSRYRKALEFLSISQNEVIFKILATGIDKKYLIADHVNIINKTLKNYHPKEVVDKYINCETTRSLDLVSKARYVDFKFYLPDDILVKVDRASMGVSLEARAPMLDYKFIELASRIPPHKLVNASQGKLILKKAVGKILPKENIYRRKMGFEMPLGQWFKKELRPSLDLLQDKNEMRFVNKAASEQLIGRHMTGSRDYAYMLHSLLFLEKWAKTWM